MKRTLLLVPFALALSVPAVAAPGQEPRQEPPRQTAKSNYWLSRDMQRLVFWQARAPEAQAAPPAAAH